MASLTLIAWLKAAWPAYRWDDALVYEACFHDVAVLAPEVAGRVSCHGEQTARVQNEHAVAEVLAQAALPYEVPCPLSGVVSLNGRAGMLTSFVAGVSHPDIEWKAAALQFQAVLAAFTAASQPEILARLPGPRMWCGGVHWPDLVRENLVPRLPRDLRCPASMVVAKVLEVEASADGSRLVHGDLGPHNVLWKHDQIFGLVDVDHACCGDPAIDVASLISFFGAEQVGQIVDRRLLDRAMIHRASLSLQLAAAAELLDDTGLRDHALGNFIGRSRDGTLHDPDGRRPNL